MKGNIASLKRGSVGHISSIQGKVKEKQYSASRDRKSGDRQCRSSHPEKGHRIVLNPGKGIVNVDSRKAMQGQPK